MGETFNTHGDRRDVYIVLVGKTEEGDHLEDQGIEGTFNINIDFQAVGYGNMEWTVLAQDRDRHWSLVNAVMNRRVPQYTVNVLPS